MTAIGVDREVNIPFGRERVFAMAVAAVLMAALIVPELGYVPIWDGRVYANCVIGASYTTISTETLRCAGHPSQGWAIWLALPQLLSPGSVEILHLSNLVLGILAVIAFRVVIARIFPDPAHARALDLIAIAAAVHPVVISTLLQPNVDFGVYVWSMVMLAGLLSQGPLALFVAVAGALFLVFSKETGLVVYAFGSFMSLAIARMRNREQPTRAFLEQNLRRMWALALPFALFGIHVVMWDRTHEDSAIWKHGWQQSAADAFKFFDLSEPVFLSYAAGLFVLGFMWLVWIPVVIDGVRGLVGMFRQRATRAVPGADGRLLVAFTVFVIAVTYVLTSFRTWSNLRYFALLYPFFVLLSYAALVRLGVGARRREATLVVFIALFIVADYRSVDPVSRLVYGTFDAGEKRMYRMTSITAEFEGPGRDQLVYNLEFTGYHHVQNAFFEKIKPTNATVIGTARHVRWNIWSELDSTTARRTMRLENPIVPTYADEIDIAVRRSPGAWYLEFSNRSDDDHSLPMLTNNYREVETDTIVARGHRMIAHRLVRREAQTLP